ncbi:MAG: ATP-dependent zinc protease [Flammeovirgaceae bacterium]
MKDKIEIIEKINSFPKKILGATDFVDLPELNLLNVSCKIDTGADVSALHCEKVRLVEKDGVEYISIVPLDPSHHQYQRKVLKFRNFKEKKIKNSFGDSEFRYSIRTNIFILGEIFPVELTLTDRGNMKYPLLLGKNVLKNRFLVDVSLKNISFDAKV